MTNISKSRFQSGLQCEKKIYFDTYQNELKSEPSAEQMARFRMGHTIGLLAQNVFPNGKDANEDINQDWGVAIQRTRDWLASGESTIYEASFSFEGGFAAVDILNRKDGELHLIEVKSSTELKDYYIDDAAYQYFVMQKAGHKPDRVFVMYVNKAYVKRGNPVWQEFFKLEDITDRVKAAQIQIELKHKEFITMLRSRIEPDKSIGSHCSNPYPCTYKAHCFRHLPENHVFKLRSSYGKSEKLYKMGINDLTEIPEDFKLSHTQMLQVRGLKYEESYLDPKNLKKFLETIEEPIYFFYFETIDPMIPILEGSSPAQKIAFQYSCHQTDKKGNIVSHRVFLANPEDFSDATGIDPRKKMIEQLKQDIGLTGSVMTYFASFEKGRLEEMAKAFPEDREFLENLIKRIIDLYVPFQSGWYYKPEMKGSASIKSVLPSIAPEFTYSNLAISHGGLASETFMKMVDHTYEGDIAAEIQNLLDYCERDTEGMVVIYRHLIKVMIKFESMEEEIIRLARAYKQIDETSPDHIKEAEILEEKAFDIIMSYGQEMNYIRDEDSFNSDGEDGEEEMNQEEERMLLSALCLKKADIAELMWCLNQHFWPEANSNKKNFLKKLRASAKK